MSNELHAAARYLKGRLSSAELTRLVQGRVYRNVAPPKATFPLVLFRFMGGLDTEQAGAGGRVLFRPLYQVKAVAQDTSYELAGQIADAIEGALVGAVGTASFNHHTHHFRGAIREGPLEYDEVLDGVRYCHVGGLYRLITYEA